MKMPFVQKSSILTISIDLISALEDVHRFQKLQHSQVSKNNNKTNYFSI